MRIVNLGSRVSQERYKEGRGDLGGEGGEGRRNIGLR